jgi:hypothetical protein
VIVHPVAAEASGGHNVVMGPNRDEFASALLGQQHALPMAVTVNIGSGEAFIASDPD